MKKSQLKKVSFLQEKLRKLCLELEGTKFDSELGFGNGLESEQLDCAIAALDCILQEY